MRQNSGEPPELWRIRLRLIACSLTCGELMSGKLLRVGSADRGSRMVQGLDQGPQRTGVAHAGKRPRRVMTIMKEDVRVAGVGSIPEY
jgi:hypothetical protein